MKKKYLIILAVLLILLVIITIFIKRELLFKTKNFLFYLEDKYYNSEVSIEISSVELEQKMKDKESFAVFIHQPNCSKSYAFNLIQSEFQKQNNITFNKILFEEMKKTELNNTIKYYPSFAIFKDGKLVDYLDAESDEDLNKYKDYNEFSNWIYSYIKE